MPFFSQMNYNFLDLIDMDILTYERTFIYLANTHPAVENLKRKVSAQNCEFYIVKRILINGNINRD